MRRVTLEHEYERVKIQLKFIRGFTVQHVIVCKYNTTTFTHRTCLLDSSPANTVKIPGGCGKFSPTQSTTLSRTDMLRLCNSLTRQVERSQEATNAKRQLNSSHIINSLKRSRVRERFSSKVDNFVSEAPQFCFFMQVLKSL